MRATVSIVLPVYNAEGYISKCINSILQQSYEDWELIIVNDGSKDASLSICSEFAKQDSRIVIIDQENTGPSGARNNGINAAQGDYITFVDADDSVSKDYVKKLLEPFLENANIQLSCCGYFELSSYNPNGIALHDLDSFKPQKDISVSQFLSVIFTGVTGVLWGKLFVTGIIKNNGVKLNQNIRLSEDLVFVMEYSKFVNRAAIVPECLYYYNRLNENGLSGYLNVGNVQDLLISNAEIRKLNVDIPTDTLTASLEKRLFYGLLKISRDICLSGNLTNTKINELKYLYKEFHHILFKQLYPLSVENRIHLLLLKTGHNYFVIKYNIFMQNIRKIRQKI